MSKNLETINFHKRTFFPSSPNSLVPNFFNPNQVYFSSGSKLVLYDFIESKKILRINTKGAKILSLKQDELDQDKMFILDIENVIYIYKISTKEILASSQLPKQKKYLNFELISNKFLYFLSEDEYTLTKLQIIINEEGKEELKKLNEYQILKPSKKEKPEKISHFIILEDFLIFSISNELFIHNLLTKENENIRFQKKITKISKMKEKSICIGDNQGKIHFIMDITDKNYLLYTKHWHSHMVNDLLLDPNNDYLYSCGQEGVVVIWNIHTWVKNFLPRLGEPILKMRVSNDSKNMICYLKNNSIVFISLTYMKIIDVISAISFESSIDKFTLFNKKIPFITFTNTQKGIINMYNIKTNTFDFYLNVFNKNFNSKTEREKDNNLRTLKKITFSSPKNSKNICYMMTIEELPYEEKSKNDILILTYMKIWKFDNSNFDMVELCENPHNNDEILFIEGLNFNDYGFITMSKKNFKIWKLNNEKFICDFEGNYQGNLLKSVNYDNNLIQDSIFALFDNKLITYQNKKIKEIYALEGNYEKLYYVNNQYICLYSSKNLAIYDFEDNEVVYEEKFQKDSTKFIIKVLFQNGEEVLNVFIGLNDRKDLFYILKYNISSVKNNHCLKIEKCFVVEKKNYEFIDVFKNYFLIINARKEFFIANENENNKKDKVSKKEMEDKDIDL